MRLLLFYSIIICFFACSKSDDSPSGSIDDNLQQGETSFLPCENGFAGEYPCNGYNLLGHLPLSEFEAQSANDIWGWTDMNTGKEYALMGLDNGTAFIDITDTENLMYLGKLPTATSSSSWRDIKVYGNFAYIVAEAAGHGVQIFDLTKLRNAGNSPVTFEEDGRYAEIGNAHNIVINETSGFAYPVGTDRNDIYDGGVHFLDLSNPTVPMASGGWGVNGYTHDAQVVTYDGPDADYLGAEIFVGANESQVVVVDISDKENPQEIATLPYPNIGYTHQGWFTEDQRYFILGDELDEINAGFRSRTLIFDMSDLGNPELYDTYLGPTNAIDHNGYVLGNEFFLANYTAGLRILDITDIEAKNITEVGFFDTFPSNNNTDFDGVWSVYPFFESGKVILSDISNGFFVIEKSQ